MEEPETTKPNKAQSFRFIRSTFSFIRHRWLVSSLAFVLILTGLAGGSLLLQQPAQAESNANIVILTYDNEQRVVPTALPTVGALLAKLHIQINPGDVVEPALSAPINQAKFRINIYRARPVEIVDGNHVMYTYSAAASPRTVAAEAGVKVYAEDDLNQGPVMDFAKDDSVGEKLVIDRATPVDLMLYGHSSVVRTQTKTVADLVKEKGITLKKGDKLSPSPDTPLKAGLRIEVNHKGTKFITKTETIEAPVKYIADAKLSIGSSAVRQQGKDGEREVTYKIRTRNGHEIGREIVQKVITRKPVEEVVARGTAMVPISGSHSEWMDKAGISDSDQPYADYIIRHESNWNPASLNPLGCAGLGQACPGGKLAAACPSWQSDPICQLKFFSGYAAGKGGWRQAYLFKVANGWW